MQICLYSQRKDLAGLSCFQSTYSGKKRPLIITKYITKGKITEKLEGEEKGRLFGLWGGVRSVYSRFRISSRMFRKRKVWLAEELEPDDDDGFKTEVWRAPVVPPWKNAYGFDSAD